MPCSFFTETTPSTVPRGAADGTDGSTAVKEIDAAMCWSLFRPANSKRMGSRRRAHLAGDEDRVRLLRAAPLWALFRGQNRKEDPPGSGILFDFADPEDLQQQRLVGALPGVVGELASVNLRSRLSSGDRADRRRAIVLSGSV